MRSMGGGVLSFLYCVAFTILNLIPVQAGAGGLALIDQPWRLHVYAGQLSTEDLGVTITPGGANLVDTYFLGGALNRPFLAVGPFTVEFEAGAGTLFGDDAGGQVWTALYGRYQTFPWNHIVYTTLGASIGLDYTFEKMAFEENEYATEHTRNLLHFFSPEITFARPEDPDTELVFRLHHRSAVWGAFGCDHCGSNIVTVGIRKPL